MASRSFSDNLLNRCCAVGSPICVGIDPRPELLPTFLRTNAGCNTRGLARSFARFAELMAEAACDLAPIVKLQLAFFEALGSRGLVAYEHAVRCARERGLLVIADAKRGDIGTTAAAYAEAFFGERAVRGGYAADAITLNPYLGTDSVEPFLQHIRNDGRGVFLLVKTSNPSSREIQESTLADGRHVYDAVADMVATLGRELGGNSGYSSIGMVVGATFPEELRKLRAAHPHSWFLVPGYGAQGGSARTVRAAFDSLGHGALIASSREIMSGALDGGDSRPGAVAGVRRVLERMKANLSAANSGPH